MHSASMRMQAASFRGDVARASSQANCVTGSRQGRVDVDGCSHCHSSGGAGRGCNDDAGRHRRWQRVRLGIGVTGGGSSASTNVAGGGACVAGFCGCGRTVPGVRRRVNTGRRAGSTAGSACTDARGGGAHDLAVAGEQAWLPHALKLLKLLHDWLPDAHATVDEPVGHCGGRACGATARVTGQSACEAKHTAREDTVALHEGTGLWSAHLGPLTALSRS